MSNMQKPVIELKNIWVQYDDNVILREINLTLSNQIFLGVIGPNGGGKTTFLKVLLGLIQPSKGEVRIYGKKPKEARNLMGYVPQQNLFDPNFPIRVWEAVLMGRLPHVGLFKPYSAEDKQAALDSLKQVDMYQFRNYHIGELSGGQRQRIIIARALVTQPKLLLLDEPTASVDKPMQTSVYELLSELKKKMAIVMVTHDIGVVSTYVDKIACLSGKLYYHDSKDIVKEELEEAYHCPIDLIGHGVPHRVVHEHQ